jgi:hypothetical protein
VAAAFLRLADAAPGGLEALLSDGLHLSAAGNAALARAVLDRVRVVWPDWAPEALPLDAPLWRKLAGSGERALCEKTKSAAEPSMAEAAYLEAADEDEVPRSG